MTEQYQNNNTPNAVIAVVDQLIERAPWLSEARENLLRCYRAIVNVFEKGGILYICGNGGSFADAIHIKGELAKSFEKARPITDQQVIARLKSTELGSNLLDNLEQGLPVIVLGESHSLRSAFENDPYPVFSYAQELNSFLGRVTPGILIGISTSGNAKNVAAAMTVAQAYKITTISFTGPNGGQIAKMADIPWQAPGDSTADIQENQLILYHALCKMIEAHFFNQSR